MTGPELCRVFGMVRCDVLKEGLPWQGVRADHAKAADMAEQIEADAAAHADVPPTMRLFFRTAKAGRYDRAAQMVRDPAFAFGAWCSRFTALREEIHGRQPAAPLSPEERQRVEARERAARASAASVAGTDAKIAELRAARARAVPAPPREKTITVIGPDGAQAFPDPIAELAQAKAVRDA